MNILLQNINLFLVFAIIFQAFIFTIIFIREKKRPAVKILGFYEFAYFITYIIVFLYHLKAYKIYIPTSAFLFPLYALLSVLFYLFIKRLTRSKLQKKQWIHFILPISLLVSNLVIMSVLDYQVSYSILIENKVLDKSDGWQSAFLYLNTTLYPLLVIIQAFFYVALNIYEIYGLKRKIKEEFSYEKGINLKWATEVLLVFTSFFVISLFIKSETFNFAYILFIAILIGTNSVNYVHKHYNALIESQKFLNNSQEKNSRYSYSSLSENEKKKLIKKVEDYMLNDKKFLDPNLRLSTMAQKLDTNRQYISQVINEYNGQNFYHFTNKFRIDEFIKMYKEGQLVNLSIEGMANKVGFKSKSSFYGAFKKVKGTTPKEFLKDTPVS